MKISTSSLMNQLSDLFNKQVFGTEKNILDDLLEKRFQINLLLEISKELWSSFKENTREKQILELQSLIKQSYTKLQNQGLDNMNQISCLSNLDSLFPPESLLYFSVLLLLNKSKLITSQIDSLLNNGDKILKDLLLKPEGKL